MTWQSYWLYKLRRQNPQTGSIILNVKSSSLVQFQNKDLTGVAEYQLSTAGVPQTRYDRGNDLHG